MALETGFAGLHPPPSSPFEPGNFQSGSDRPFVPGFALPVSGPFGLCGRPLSLAAISAALSPHPKIPFLTDQGSATASDFCRTGARPRRRWQRRFGRALLLRIQPKRHELATPLCRRITQLRDVDVSRQAAYGSADQLGSKKGCEASAPAPQS